MTVLSIKKLKRTVNEAINPILIVSQLAAVCTITRNSNKKEFVVSRLLVIFQIAVTIVSVAHLAFIPYGIIQLENLPREEGDNGNGDRGLNSQTFITKMTNILLLSVAAVSVRIFSLIRMHKCLPPLMKAISNVDHILNTKNDRDALWILTFSFLLVLISWPYQLYSIIMVTTNNWTAFLIFSLNLYNNFSMIACEFQFISLSWIVKTRFVGLNEELREFGLSIVVDTDEAALNKISRIKKAYRGLHEGCVHLSALYGFQLLMILSCLSLCAMFNLYFAIFGGFKRDLATVANQAQQVPDAMNEVIWSLYYFGRFFFLCVAAGQLVEQLWTFLAFAMSNQVLFSACGFFTVDVSLITSAVSAGATYLVILAQFQIKR